MYSVYYSCKIPLHFDVFFNFLDGTKEGKLYVRPFKELFLGVTKMLFTAVIRYRKNQNFQEVAYYSSE